MLVNQRVFQVQAVIFDLDGTLLDFEGVSHVALEAPLARRGAKLPWERDGGWCEAGVGR